MNQTSEMIVPSYALELLRTIAKNEGFHDFTFTIGSGCNYADGFVSDLFRITIEGIKNNQLDQLSLIVKIPPENKARREQLFSSLVFEREIFIYNEFLPMIEKFQKDKGLTPDNGFFNFAKCYGTIADKQQDIYCLVLEDLKASGYSMWNKLNEIELERVELVIKEHAKLHAISFALKDQKPDMLEKYYAMSNTMMPVMEGEGVIMAVKFSYDIAIATLNPIKDREAIEKMIALKEHNLEQLRFCFNPQNSYPFTVINHGDSWSNNMMFSHKKSTNELDKVCFIDWQMTRPTSPVLDIIYFIFTSAQKPLRDQYYNRLISTYYNTLADTIRLFGSDPEKLFTFDDFHGQLRKFGKFGVIMGVMLLQAITTDAKDIPNLDELAENMANQDVKESILNSASQEKYDKRMSDLIRDIIDLGYL